MGAHVTTAGIVPDLASLTRARPIGARPDTGHAPILARRFTLEDDHGQVVRATLTATAHGIYQASLNGRPVDAALFTPGWTAYEWRLQVRAHDLTPHLRADNHLEVLMGNGWWRGDLGFAHARANYGDHLALLAVIELVYSDGHVQHVGTDTDWSAHSSQVASNSLYNGQTIDFTHSPGTLTVEPVEFDTSVLVPAEGAPVVRHETLRPVRIWRSPSGETMVDFGQNLVGWLRFTVRGERGTEVRIRHAEVLADDELATEPLRAAAATDRAILSGGDDRFEPTLTFHGFRYAELTGWPGLPTADDLEAVVVHSAMPRTGWFTCSEPLVNQLVSNAVWGQRGNFLEVPTDCPQRDERLGWTGDIAAFAPSACFQFDVADFLHRWMLDLDAETRAAAGIVPLVIPDVLKHGHLPDDLEVSFTGPFAVWGDAAVWVPQALWHAYGDLDRLAAHYPAMAMHVDGVAARLSPTGLWDTGNQLGDWLDPDAPPEHPGAAKADPSVIATACLYRSARFTAEAARILGQTVDADRYEHLAETTRSAFNTHYVGRDGRITSDCATVYALALCFGLLDAEPARLAGDRLAAIVATAGYRISTGFAGTPYVTWALSRTGHTDDAYRLLLQTECPSWLYPVGMGATTIWERWDSMLPDGSLNTGDMTSFNHYALGAVVDWLHQVVAGIRPARPGYAAVRFAPQPGPGLDWARAALDSRHGRVECGWERRDGEITVTVTVPDGVEATLALPDGRELPVPSGTHTIAWR
jgi:alpha-L-rhamnosidase